MAFNLNRNNHPDYILKNRQINELINMYGVECDLLFTERVNIDNVLKDFSHLKLSEGDSKKVYLLPEDPNGFDGSYNWNLFGLQNNLVINFFISNESVESVLSEKEKTIKDVYAFLTNKLITLPNGLILEITDVSSLVEGVNNLFLYKDIKSVYKLTTKVYYNSKQNEMEYDKDKKDSLDTLKQNQEQLDSEAPKVDYQEEPETDNYEGSFEDLDSYFKSLDENNEEFKEEKKIQSGINSDNVFGSLG